MAASNSKQVVVLKGNQYIMPRAAKPVLASRPKPAPSPSSKSPKK